MPPKNKSLIRRVASGSIPVIDDLIKESLKIGICLAFLGFTYAGISFANGSRDRFVDIDPDLSAAKLQASTDFHNWYGSLISICNIAELIIVAGLALCLFSPVIRKTIHERLGVLVVMIMVVAGSHMFCYSTYVKEANEILSEQLTYGPLFPIEFLQAQRPR